MPMLQLAARVCIAALAIVVMWACLLLMGAAS